ncbi:MAG: tetratricopeptide repeat protein [Verrucomicrobiia bacterium]
MSALMKQAAPGITARKRRTFRLVAGVLGPLLGFALLEVALRLAGFGYPTSFLLRDAIDGRELLIQNSRASWRFFGPRMARTPFPTALPPSKPPGTIRIFVFGESAAFGDPDPRFGLPRMLEALLGGRFPDTRFEIVNAAMTGINSHAILPLARSCLPAEGDLWVVYMGNNEVVGPFGAGTIFGPRAPPLFMVRARLALLETRTGQLLEKAFGRLFRSSLDESEWGGMEMFLKHPVQADAPDLARVRHHFTRNLEDIIEAGRRGGAAVVVSTVAVNLADCAPFGSAHRNGLTDTERATWDSLYQQAAQSQAAGNHAAAVEPLSQAARIDDQFAELRFRQGITALQTGQAGKAARHFQAARDLDTLRFRCDTQLNETIRKAAADRDRDQVFLADAEKAFAQSSTNALPGQDFFLDHVHLTFGGNYLLARTIAEQVERALSVRGGALSQTAPWPTLQACAHRLAWTDWSWKAAAEDIFRRLTEPPFTAQVTQPRQLARLRALLERLAPSMSTNGAARAQAVTEAALAMAPEDPWLHYHLAAHKLGAGNAHGAAESARRMVQLLPSSGEGWAQLGRILAHQQRFDEAAEAFRREFALDTLDVWALQNLGQALVKLGRQDEAEQTYRRAVAIKPRFGLAWLGLGQLLEQSGQTNEAQQCYQEALANPILRPAELVALARFCISRGWMDAAVTNYIEAVSLSAPDPNLRLELGQTLARLRRHGEAAAQFAETVRLAPEFAEARFLYGLALGREGKPAEAVEQFQEVVRLKPDLLEARLNLGLALIKLGRRDEALAQFEEVLAKDPSNAIALRHVQTR